MQFYRHIPEHHCQNMKRIDIKTQIGIPVVIRIASSGWFEKPRRLRPAHLSSSIQNDHIERNQMT
jgi:hypothetical protein